MKHIEQADKALKYLEGKPFSHAFILIDEFFAPISMLLEKEFPDYDPRLEDFLIIEGETYVVVRRVYHPEKNSLTVAIQDFKTYEKRIKNEYQRV